MGRFCYRSQILPGKTERVRQHWKEKKVGGKEDALFWQSLTMTGFESYLQCTPNGDFMIHCLEGESLEKIFKGLREAISNKHPIATALQKFYLEVLGKDYSLPETQPRVECLSDHSMPNPPEKLARRVFFYPLLPEKEAEHRLFRKEAMGKNRKRHEASMQAFGTFRHTVWLQHDETGPILIHDSERLFIAPSSKERLALGKSAPEWQEISKILIDHTGLSYDQLSPDVERLTTK